MSSKYNSKQDFFIATDLYNLPLPVLPPADLSIAYGTLPPDSLGSSGFTAPSYLFYRSGTGTKVAGFAPNDNAYIRGLGLSSNLADGLVASSSAVGAGNGWGFRLRGKLFGAPIAGITNVSGAPGQITGGAGNFERYLAPGMTVMWLDNNNVARLHVIASIAAGGNSLTLSSNASFVAGTMFTADTTNKNLYPLLKNAGGSIDFSFLSLNVMNPASFFAWDASSIYAPRGKMSVALGGTAVTGVGTFFQTDFAVGQPIGYTDDSGIRRTGFISSIASQTSLALTAGSAALAAATNAAVLDINSFIAIEVTMFTTFTAYTITIDPLFGNGTRRMSLNAMAEIEYTVAMPSVGAIGQ